MLMYDYLMKTKTVSTRHLAPRGDTTLMEESVSNTHGDLFRENINLVEDTDSTERSENRQQSAEKYSGNEGRNRNPPKYLEDIEEG
ncbi:hypothetical protein JTB14_016306 [Gonioctena quinquepunctata]|nr:hypothetical protein JTB14_016306 [Gonioctena quinquepunctata]